MEYTYHYRGFPCSIAPNNELWCVSGHQVDAKGKTTISGVLEWCYDETDAEIRLYLMRKDPTFRNLKAHPFFDPKTEQPFGTKAVETEKA